MEIHQVRYFVAVADHENFTRAAEACNVSQPSLSQQIIKLEEELGQPLFDRLGRQVRLTDAGRRFYPHASGILVALDDAREEMAESLDGHGRLSVGAILTVAPYLLPGVTKQLLATCPRAEISIREDLTERVLAAVLDGDLDAAVIALPVEDPRLEVTELFDEPLWLAMPPGHPLASTRRVDLGALSGEPFILLDPIHCLGDQVLSFCRSSECLPRVVCQTSQILTVQALVSLGMGVSLLPRMACEADVAGRCCYRPLSGQQPIRTLAVARHAKRHRGPLFDPFVEAARQWGAARG